MKDDSPLLKWIPQLMRALEDQDQARINEYAFKITEWIWIPTIDMTFEELLYSYGYKEIKTRKRR